tara:strand:+ start:152 stop:472 length:321 start_codon:yes stop_codon:yes gene_type:complete
MLITIIILSVLLAVTVWLLIIQIKKGSKLEGFLELYVRMLSVMALRTNRAYKRMQEVDRLGSFEADDETGYIFQEIKAATTDLNEFVSKYITNDDDTEEKEKSTKE